MLRTSLKQLLSQRSREVSRRLKQALEELSQNIENLSNNHRRARVPVQVPVRNSRLGQRRQLHTMLWHVGLGAAANARLYQRPCVRWCHPRYFSLSFTRYLHYSFHPYHNVNFFRGQRAPRGSVMFNNFSSKYQNWFRLKMHSTPFTKTSIVSMIREGLNIDNNNPSSLNMPKANHFKSRTLRKAQTSTTPNIRIRLNISLSPKFHEYLLNLHDSHIVAPEEELQVVELPKSCYLDFSFNPNVLIPSSTFLNEDVLGEILRNITFFEKKLKEIKRDLKHLSELGELPLKYIPEKNIIRVFFKNCDRQRLEILLSEKSITSGVIIEEDSKDVFEAAVSSGVSDISEFDILSSLNGNSNSLSSFNSNDEELISSSEEMEPLSDKDIMRLEVVSPQFVPSEVQISDEDYCWN